MAAMHKFSPSQGISPAPGAGGYGACKVEEAVPDHFPVGLRVLVVDDDTSCLKILEQMLRKCEYQVTTCCRARVALSLLRERKGGFDLVISDVHMPDMDGFKLLESVGLEMDLPVIMMSADGRTSAVMKGIKHGACDYLIKPVRMEELKNIWQHVIRKKRWNGSKDDENSGSLEDSDRQRRCADEEEYASSVNDGNDSSWKAQKKRREAKEDEDGGDQENDDSSATKKPRVVWSVELHQQFVSAVDQLGIDKAVPKRILELMNVPGLTRENVASHLQKFRQYLKRLSGVAQQQGGISNPYCSPTEPNSKANALGRLDFQAATASVHIPSHTMTALHAELLGRPSGAVLLSDLEQSSLIHSGARFLPTERGIAFGQPLVKCPSGVQKFFPQPNMALGDMTSGFSSWSSPNLLASSHRVSNRSTPITPSSNLIAQQMPPQQQSQSILSDSTHSINLRQEAQTITVQPSCLITPQSSDNFRPLNSVDPINSGSMSLPSLPSVAFHQTGGASMPVIQNSSLNDGIQMVQYSLMSPQLSNLSQDIGEGLDGEQKSIPVLSEFSIPSPVSSGLACNEVTPSWKLQNPATNFMSAPSSSLVGRVDLSDIQNSVMHKASLTDRGQLKNLGYVGRGMSIPSRFAIDDIESHTDNFSRKETSYSEDGSRGRQEIHVEFAEGSKLDSATMAHSSPSDLMSILSK